MVTVFTYRERELIRGKEHQVFWCPKCGGWHMFYLTTKKTSLRCGVWRSSTPDTYQRRFIAAQVELRCVGDLPEPIRSTLLIPDGLGRATVDAPAVDINEPLWNYRRPEL